MPTKLDFDFNRSVARLDTSAGKSGIFTPEIASIEINEQALPRFNAVALSLAPELKPMNVDQIAGVCRRVLRAAAKGAESPFIKVRLRRAAEMRAALTDPGWSMETPACERVRELVAYMDDPAGPPTPETWPAPYDPARAAPMRAVLTEILKSALAFARS